MHSPVETALRREREHLIPCVYHFFGDDPVLLTRGDRCHLIDHAGKPHLDLYSGVAVMALGHSDPALRAAIHTQVDRLQHSCTIHLTEEYGLLAERLASIAPGDLRRSFFVNSGSEANEGALLLARLATGRRKFVALDRGLHGRTHLAMSVTGLPMWRTDPHLSDCVVFAPSPVDDPSAEGVAAAIAACGDDFAGLIAEPIQGNGGINVAPAGYFTRVANLVHAAGGLLIIDEVQTGIGRTGRWFAIEHWGVTPDIMTTAKALGGGTPLGAFIATDEVARHWTKPGGSTLGGNPVSCRAALATIDGIEQRGLLANAEGRGRELMDGLRALQSEHPEIREVRGIGLMVGAGLVDPETGEPASALLEAIHREMRERGFLLGKTGPGRNVLTFQPPLIITSQQIAQSVSALAECLETIKVGSGDVR